MASSLFNFSGGYEPTMASVLSVATISIGLTGAAHTASQGYETPERGTMLRRDLMNAVRPLVEQELGDPVIFIVDDLRHKGNVAFGALTPVRPAGKPIVWADTPLAQKGESEDFYDGLAVQALYRRHGKNWSVAAWAIGATDVWYADPKLCKEFKTVLPQICGMLQ